MGMICEGLIGKKEVLAVVSVLLIVIGLPIACTQAAATPTPPPEKIPINATIVAVLAILFIFLLLIVLGYWADKSLDKGEMRRAIASMLAVGFVILVFLSLRYTIPQNEVVTAFIGIAGMGIGYYFGARTAAERRAEAAAKIGIEHVKFVDDADPKKRKMVLTIRNGGDSEIKVDKIYINEGAFETDIKIDSQKSKEIEQVYEWESKTEYKIKIATMTGLTAEITKKSPEKTPEAES